jgi:hypothetical protein
MNPVQAFSWVQRTPGCDRKQPVHGDHSDFPNIHRRRRGLMGLGLLITVDTMLPPYGSTANKVLHAAA